MTSPAADPTASPYSAAGGAGSAADHNYSKSVPWSDNGYSDSPIQAYADKPSTDADRLNLRTRVDSRANPANVEGWYNRNHADIARRESVTKEVSTGWAERKGGSGRAAAPRPLGKDTGEPRPTTAMGPNTYYFERPFDAGMARHFTGDHFSMADHRRTYEIYGMEPVAKVGRNTYRIEPGPTDLDITDMPTSTNYVPQYAQAPADVPVSAIERSWRL